MARICQPMNVALLSTGTSCRYQHSYIVSGTCTVVVYLETLPISNAETSSPEAMTATHIRHSCHLLGVVARPKELAALQALEPNAELSHVT